MTNPVTINEQFFEDRLGESLPIEAVADLAAAQFVYSNRARLADALAKQSTIISDLSIALNAAIIGNGGVNRIASLSTLLTRQSSVIQLLIADLAQSTDRLRTAVASLGETDSFDDIDPARLENCRITHNFD